MEGGSNEQIVKSAYIRLRIESIKELKSREAQQAMAKEERARKQEELKKQREEVVKQYANRIGLNLSETEEKLKSLNVFNDGTKEISVLNLEGVKKSFESFEDAIEYAVCLAEVYKKEKELEIEGLNEGRRRFVTGVLIFVFFIFCYLYYLSYV